MAWGNFVLDKSYDAVGAITKFRMVKYNGVAEQVVACTGITDVPAGVEQFGATVSEIAKGKGASVRILGISEQEAGGAIAIGNMCQLESNGTVTAAVGSSGKRLVGRCVGTPSSNSGDRISMLVIHGLGLS